MPPKLKEPNAIGFVTSSQSRRGGAITYRVGVKIDGQLCRGPSRQDRRSAESDLAEMRRRPRLEMTEFLMALKRTLSG